MTLTAQLVIHCRKQISHHFRSRVLAVCTSLNTKTLRLTPLVS
jgi:hypothetical protein